MTGTADWYDCVITTVLPRRTLLFKMLSVGGKKTKFCLQAEVRKLHGRGVQQCAGAEKLPTHGDLALAGSGACDRIRT